MYNENQLSSLRYRCLLFFLFQLRLVLLFIISYSCQKFILSLHEVRFPLTTIRAAEVRHPVSDVPLKRSAKQRKYRPRGDKIHLGIFGTLNVFVAFIVDNFGRKRWGESIYELINYGAWREISWVRACITTFCQSESWHLQVTAVMMLSLNVNSVGSFNTWSCWEILWFNL